MNKNLTLMIVFAVSLTFISCSDDSKDASVSTSLTGAYRLTVALLPELQDYDKDSDSSTNAVLEGGCYNDSWISFHNDGTYDQSISKSSTIFASITIMT